MTTNQKENRMTVEILHCTPIEILDKSLVKCWGSECKSGDDMLKRIDRIINKNKHGSIAEHCTVSFDIRGVSRALLQELARHRVQSLTVASTRYRLGELKLEKQFLNEDSETYEETYLRASKYLVWTHNADVDYTSIKQLELLRQTLLSGVSNDIAKYNLCEAYKVDLVSTWNIRSLMNLFELRTDKSALWEFRDLANAMFNVLPDEYKFLLKDYVKVVE